jgi:hypothetical protein
VEFILGAKELSLSLSTTLLSGLPYYIKVIISLVSSIFGLNVH